MKLRSLECAFTVSKSQPRHQKENVYSLTNNTKNLITYNIFPVSRRSPLWRIKAFSIRKVFWAEITSDLRPSNHRAIILMPSILTDDSSVSSSSSTHSSGSSDVTGPGVCAGVWLRINNSLTIWKKWQNQQITNFK